MDQECRCGYVCFKESDDGYLYCGNCYDQFGDIITCIDKDDPGIYNPKRARPIPVTPAKFWDGVGPTGPSDFGSGPVKRSYEYYYSVIRRRYVIGFEIMLQIQCKALVKHFNVSQNIVTLHNPIWLRLLACTRVTTDDWADEVLLESENHNLGEVIESQRSARYIAEPQNMFGQRAVMIWYRSLRRCLPISYTLALSFLFCHLAEEPILPTDILRGVLEGKIPYFSAFVDIEKQVKELGGLDTFFPVSWSAMFRPTQVISLQKLEATAAFISEKIGLELRPLNFNSLATRYIEELSLPVPRILPLASRIYEWSTPQGIYLSSNELKLPSRVCLMSILIVAIRIYYNINGFSNWESTISNSRNSLPRDKLNGKEKHTLGFDRGTNSQEKDFFPHNRSKDYKVHESDVVELLHTLVDKFKKLGKFHDTFEHYKDLPSYLRLCEDGIFAGLEPIFENNEEKEMMKDLWEFYQPQKIQESETSKHGIKRPREDEVCDPSDSPNLRCDGIACNTLQGGRSQFSEDKSNREDIVQETPLEVSSCQSRTIRSVKRDMDDDKFVYIPPRSNVKKGDHIYYSRKKNNGEFVYAVHSDYYILLRSCAKACQVDVRTMHIGVLTFERGLQERKRVN